MRPHSLSGWIGFRKKPGAKGLVLAHDGSNTLNYCTAILVPDQNLAFCVLTNQGGPKGPAKGRVATWPRKFAGAKSGKSQSEMGAFFLARARAAV